MKHRNAKWFWIKTLRDSEDIMGGIIGIMIYLMIFVLFFIIIGSCGSVH